MVATIRGFVASVRHTQYDRLFDADVGVCVLGNLSATHIAKMIIVCVRCTWYCETNTKIDTI